MIIDRKPEPNKDVKVHVLHKITKKMAAGIGMWDGESWKLRTPLGYAPVPISLEVLGWDCLIHTSQQGKKSEYEK